jgi:isopentenyl-diphosphate delta-isomerase
MNSKHRVVSSESEELILVDERDNEIGHLAKATAHDGGGVLHRAFSVFLFDTDGRLLLQKRAAGKRLWPGYWSNTCCSHPRRGESLQEATSRRLQDELNVVAGLEFVYKFCYQAGYGNAGAENELCHVFLGRTTQGVRANRHEIAELEYLSVDELETAFEARPDDYTPWFRMEWRTLREHHAARLEAYIGDRA